MFLPVSLIDDFFLLTLIPQFLREKIFSKKETKFNGHE